MRHVKFKDYDSETKQWIEGTGRFHQWGQSFVETSEGPPSAYTYGIVEDAEGRIWEVAPHHIQFIKDPRNDERGSRAC